MLPDDDLGVTELPVEMIGQRVERRRHVTIAQVPRRHLGAVHLLVVLLGVTHHERVLFRMEELVFGDPTVATQVGIRAMTQRDQLGDHFVLAGHCTLVGEGVAVGLAGAADVVEAGVALAGPTGLRRIDGIEVPDDRLHRRRQAVQVEAVEADLRRGMALCVVARSEPLHELEDLAVAPHPRREPTEVGERRAASPSSDIPITYRFTR